MEPGDIPKTEECNADDCSSSTRLTSQGSTVPGTNRSSEYTTAGSEHPSVDYWNKCGKDPEDTLSQIMSTLKGLQWSGIHVFRVGPRNCETKDLALVVSIWVEGGSFDWEQGNAVVLRCQEILDQHGFPDVYCELGEVAPRRLEDYRRWILKDRGRHYYKDLPSNPTFLARSPDPTWNPPINNMDSGYPPSVERKFLMPIGCHPILEKRNNDDNASSLRSQVVSNLKGAKWTSVDILRCGYEGKKDAPAILFVSVEPGSTTPEEARQFADRCAVTLFNHGITDMSCEVKKSQVVPLSKLQPPSTVVDAGNLWKASYNLTDLVGATIAKSDQQGKQGTKGPYLRVKTVENGVETSSVCALTCRHVVSSSTQEPEGSGSKKVRQSCEAIVQPGIDYETEVKCFAHRLASKQESLWGDPAADEGMLGSYNARSTVESRTFGHLAYTRQGSSGRATDWALIKLDVDKHERPLDTIKNQVPIGYDVEHGYSRKYQSQGWCNASANFSFDPRPDHSIYTLRGVTPVASIQEPEKWTDPTLHGAICLAKVGHGSGLTFGIANQALSILHRPKSPQGTTGDETELDEDDDLISLAICVLSRDGEYLNLSPTSSFGIAGDSGACAWDLNGRVAGMVTAGSMWDLEDRWTNVTYVTPMEWILEDMRECGLEATLCE
ncbi:unnamed protein product [Colletotrichum noveboracense]|uniref:Uncharacterized protein n=1 Tax=Colletotrichum noveboracense TaxID=2664923 RepID=A0A9W4RJF2_9PEZI|nr:unnamed protein product [Colletotrichum noveboracense]